MTPPDPLKPAPSGEDGPFAHFQWNDSWHTWEQVVDEAAGEEGVVAAYLRPSAPSEASGEDVNAEMLAALRNLAELDYPRPVGTVWRSDGKPSKNDKCVHGAWIYDDCANCISDFAQAAIAAAERPRTLQALEDKGLASEERD